jgi:putative FmdB family regulatory protein
MPVYEYYCPTCKSRFERLRTMNEAADSSACPDCATVARRALSVFAAVSKGADGFTTPIGGAGGCACGNGACGCSAGF